MDTIHFEGRDVNPWAEYVDARDLIAGETYFAVHFVDEQMLVPELRPLVFIGVDLEIADSGTLYFQDASSHVAGLRYGSTFVGSAAEACEGIQVHTVKKETPLVLTFERALDVLLRCSVARAKLKA